MTQIRFALHIENEALCFALVLRNLQIFLRKQDEGRRFALYQRGLVVSISFFVGFAEPLSRDVEHSVPRFAFYMCATY